MRSTLLLLALLIPAGFSLLGVGDSVAKPIANFNLKDSAGKPWALADLKDRKAIVVVFLGTQCPVNNAYAPKLAELHKEYAGKGVAFVAINSNAHDTAATIAEHAKKFAIPFAVLQDDKHSAADRFGAERTPEAFVLDGKFNVRYRGRIDDQYGIGFQRPRPTRRDLALALDEVLAGKPVTLAKTPVAGCIITRAATPKKETTVTYAKDVARIVQSHCQECHRPGQIGPMPLLTYDDVSLWSGMIREVVKDGRMPPWHADPKHGKFLNDRRLSAANRDTLLTWIAQGCPRGDDKDLPAPKKFADGWSIGRPDAVFTMKKQFTVPAKAGPRGIRYQGFLVPTNFTEDVWVQAVEAKPGNRAVVHHMIVYVLASGKREKNIGDGFGSGMLVAEAPGDLAAAFPPGHAKRIPKGATLAFQMHYTPNGTEQTDRSSVALVFAKSPPKYEVKTRAIAQQLLIIPPGAENHRVFASSTFHKDALVTSLFPHMHLRGKSFEFQAVYPDGKREVLLSVPRYDFGWQSNYYLEKPLLLLAGSKIECTAHFDNSKNNRNNPDPTRLVHWGEQTWDEMMIGFVDYTFVEDAGKEEKK
jgi:peroxiredoxin/mono/diheme cytochrome c family protein